MAYWPSKANRQPTKDGKEWVVEDIVIDEVSLVENYREQFNRIIAQSGFKVLLQKMANKLVKIGGKLPSEVKSVTVDSAKADGTKNTKPTAVKGKPAAPVPATKPAVNPK